MHLRCTNPDCAETFDLHDQVLACPVCADLLEIVVDIPFVEPIDLKRAWLERRSSYDRRDLSGVWRFREFLPGGYSDSDFLGVYVSAVLRTSSFGVSEKQKPPAAGCNRTAGLQNNIAVVVDLIHVMYGNAGFGEAGGQHGFVYPVPVHALTAVGRQQCRVYVDDAACKSLHDHAGHLP